MHASTLVWILTAMTSPLELLGKADSNSMLRDELAVKQELSVFQILIGEIQNL